MADYVVMADKKNTAPPVGELYSRVYAAPTEFVADSARARARIGHYLENELHFTASRMLRSDGEIHFGSTAMWIEGGIKWALYTAKLELRDFLSLVTLALLAAWDTYTGARANPDGGRGKPELKRFGEQWIPFCRSVFAEEGLNYRIDDKGGVHPLIDEEFQLARQVLLISLSDKRYAGALDHFETAHRHLARQPPETRQAIWSMFQCIETLFQLLVGAKFNRGNIENKFTPMLVMAFPSDDKASWERIADSLSDWADAFHQYRHAQAEEAPRTPSLELCVYALSSGAPVARLLADLDRRGVGATQAKSATGK